MIIIVTARLKASGKQQVFETDTETDTFEVKRGDKVVVALESGVDIATVLSITAKTEEPGRKTLKRVVRIATDEDVRSDENNTRMEEEGRVFCQEKIKSSGLSMRLVGTRMTLDKKKFVFYFTAEKRVDFRELVKDLASKFRTRIELRQIGIRDEAKFLGGIGSCGRELCCKLFLTRFAPISIRMAKRQDIALNPSKLSGLCGRLMCCLSYEHIRDNKGGSKDKPGRSPRVRTGASISEKVSEERAEKTSEKYPATDVKTTEETNTSKPVQNFETHEKKLSSESTETSETSAGKPVQKKTGKPSRRRRRPRRKKA